LQREDGAHSYRPVDLAQLGDAPDDRPTLAGSHLYADKLHVVSGETESVKTWLLAILSLLELRAGNRVVWIDVEMGAHALLSRLRALGITDDELARFLYVAPAEKLQDSAVIADVKAMLDKRRPSLVIVDAMTGALQLQGLDPNNSIDVESFYRGYIQLFRAHGAAVVIADHVPKDRDNRGKFSIGSERKIAGCDVHLGLEMVQPFGRGRDGIARIVTHKDRPGWLPRPRAGELHLHSDPDNGNVTWEIHAADADAEHKTTTFRPTFLMGRVSEYLATLDEPVSRTHVQEHVTGQAKAVRLAIDLLVQEGYATETEGPRNARLVTHKRLYSESQDSTPTTPSDPVPTPSETESRTTPTTPSTPLLKDGVGEDGVTELFPPDRVLDREGAQVGS